MVCEIAFSVPHTRGFEVDSTESIWYKGPFKKLVMSRLEGSLVSQIAKRSENQLPKKDEFRERSRGGNNPFAEKDDLLLPDRSIHGNEANISLGHLESDATHIAYDAIDLVILSFENVEAVLDTFSSESFKLLAQKSLMLRFRHIIGKHHEHGGGKDGSERENQ